MNEGVPRYWVYVVHKPGHDLHEEDTAIRATTREEADGLADRRAKAWGCELRFVGERVNKKIVWVIPVAERPEWAREVA